MKLSLILTAIILACAVSGCNAAGETVTGKITRVIDGDTYELLDVDNNRIRIRLYGVDCPEAGQDYGERARLKAAESIAGQTVTVEIVDTDKYGRKVGIIPVGTTTLGEILLSHGLAWNYAQYNKLYPESYARLEARARADRKGLWSVPNPVAPWDYRHNPAPKTAKGSINSTPPARRVEDSDDDERLVETHETQVIICKSQNAYAYHSHVCKGLERCKAGTKKIPISEARRKNYKPCGFCY